MAKDGGTDLGAYIHLGLYIEEKMDAYVEPERKGTPKGEEIGFSRQKYGASLMNITTLKQKRIAKLLNVSYGLLRKWRTEERFREMVETHCREFARRFYGFIEELVKDELQIKKPIRLDDKENKPHMIMRRYSLFDEYRYGSQLRKRIKVILEKRITEINKRKEIGATNADDDMFLKVLERILKEKELCLDSKLVFFKQINSDITRHAEELLESFRAAGTLTLTAHYDPLSLLKKVLLQEKLSDDERDEAIEFLEYKLNVLKNEKNT